MLNYTLTAKDPKQQILGISGQALQSPATRLDLWNPGTTHWIQKKTSINFPPDFCFKNCSKMTFLSKASHGPFCNIFNNNELVDFSLGSALKQKRLGPL